MLQVCLPDHMLYLELTAGARCERRVDGAPAERFNSRSGLCSFRPPGREIRGWTEGPGSIRYCAIRIDPTGFDVDGATRMVPQWWRSATAFEDSAIWREALPLLRLCRQPRPSECSYDRTLCRGARPGTSGCPRGALRPADADRSQRSAIASLENTDRLYPGESGQCHHPRRTGLHCRYKSIAAREGLPRIDWLHTDRVCGKAEDQGGPALACFDQRPGIPDSDRSWLRGSEPFHPTVSLGDRSDSCSVSPTGTVMGRFDRGFGSPGARGSSSAMLHRTPLAERRIISGQEYACRLARRHGVSASVSAPVKPARSRW